VALDLPNSHDTCIQGQNLVIKARTARVTLGRDLRFKAGMLITGPINGQLAKVAFESLFAFAVAGIASGIGHAGILGVTQVLGHLGFQRALDKAFGQLLEQAVLADEVFRFLLPASSRSINSLLTVMVHLSGCSAVSRNLAVYKKFKPPSLHKAGSMKPDWSAVHPQKNRFAAVFLWVSGFRYLLRGHLGLFTQLATMNRQKTRLSHPG